MAKRRTFLKSTGTIGIAGLAGCTGSIGGGGGSIPTIRLGYIVPGENFVTLLPIESIQEEFETNIGESYELEMTQIQGSSQVVSLMAAGEIDVGDLGFAAYARGVLSGAVSSGLTAIMADWNDAVPGKFGFPIKVLKDSDIEEVADLEGLQLGTNAIGTGVHGVWSKALADAGIDPENGVDWVEIPFPAMAGALEEDRIKACIQVSIFSAAMRASGKFRTLTTSHEIWGRSYPFALYGATEKFLDEQTAAVEAFLEDAISLLEYMQEPGNRTAVIDGLVEEYELPRGLVESYFLTEHDVYRPPSGRIPIDGLQFAVDELQNIGFFEESLNVADHVDHSYLPG